MWLTFGRIHFSYTFSSWSLAFKNISGLYLNWSTPMKFFAEVPRHYHNEFCAFYFLCEPKRKKSISVKSRLLTSQSILPTFPIHPMGYSWLRIFLNKPYFEESCYLAAILFVLIFLKIDLLYTVLLTLRDANNDLRFVLEVSDLKLMCL